MVYGEYDGDFGTILPRGDEEAPTKRFLSAFGGSSITDAVHARKR
jgi:hypothetical protein